jgi:putative oxidoreductase
MKLLDSLAPHVHWGLRLSVAATFLYHGAGKLPADGFAAAMNMPLIVAWAVAIGELLAGVCLIVGAFSRDAVTRLGGLIVIVIMIGAIGLVHAKNGFSASDGGFEFQLLLLVTGLYFLARGNKA